MMKKGLSLLFAVVLCLCTVLPCLAQYSSLSSVTEVSLLTDEADLLTDSEENTILAKLQSISEKNKCDVAILLIDALGGKEAQAYADDFYDECGLGYGAADDGILFLFSLTDSEYAFSTYSLGMKAFSVDGMEYIVDLMRSDLKSGAYASACETYADQCDTFLTAYLENGEQYEFSPFDPGAAAVISVLIGLVIGLILVMCLRARNKTVHSRNEANDYMRRDSLQITASNEFFLYRNVTRTERQTSSGSGSGSHTSSSGRTHGGTSGKI